MTAPWLMRLALASLLAVYLQTLFFDFAYDDVMLILLNPWMKGWQHVGTIFTSTFWGFNPGQNGGGAVFYRPLTMLWLFLANKIGSGMPGFFHVGLVVMHLIVTLEVAALGKRLTRDAATGALAALIFAVHPSHIESVAWISGISDVLCAAFFLGALLAYLRWSDGEGRRWMLLSLLLLEAALLSKEAAALMVALVVCDHLRQSRESGWLARTIHALYASAPWMLLTALHFAWQMHITARYVSADSGDLLAHSPALYPYALCWYLKKQLLAVPVLAHYAPVFDGSLRPPQIVLCTAVAAAALGVAAWLAWRSRAGQLLAALFLFTLAPVVIGVQTLQLHDRYLYLPGIAVAIGAAILLRRAPGLREAPRRQFSVVLLLLVLAVPAGFREVSYWSSNLRLFQHSMAHVPHASLTQYDLADAYLQLGQEQQAIPLMRRSVAEFPNIARMWLHLAATVKRDRPAEAEYCARRVLQLRPVGRLTPEAFSILGDVALARGDLAQAESWYRHRIVCDWSRADSHRSLAGVLSQQGRRAEAAAEMRIVRHLTAANPAAR